jgi:pyruvate dehydrogenase E1 component beta subunit
MPATVADARDLLIASVLSNDPVIYIDDRWLYEQTDDLGPIQELDLSKEGPKCIAEGSDLTIVGSSYSTLLALQASERLRADGYSAEVIDLRVLSPLNIDPIIKSVKKTGRLLVVDGGWSSCGIAGEIIASVCEKVDPGTLKVAPKRVTLPASPAPTSHVLEKLYYPDVGHVVEVATNLII